MRVANAVLILLTVSGLAMAQEDPRAKKRRPGQHRQQQEQQQENRQALPPGRPFAPPQMRPNREIPRPVPAPMPSIPQVPQRNYQPNYRNNPPREPQFRREQTPSPQQPRVFPEARHRDLMNPRPEVNTSPQVNGRPGRNRPAKPQVFPAPRYPNQQLQGSPSTRRVPPSQDFRRDEIGNRFRPYHQDRVNFAQQRSENVMKRNPSVVSAVNYGRHFVTTSYRPVFESRAPIFHSYIGAYTRFRREHPSFYSRYWYNHRFYGGCYYGFYPVLDIGLYFYNPLVYWFFVPTYQASYYQTWYGSDLDAYPDLARPFRYSGLYYPTENLRQLLFGVSAMPVNKQVGFREGIEVLTQKLARRVANAAMAPVRLSKGDIVITHYEILGYDDAVSLEGFVSYGNRPYNFKGIVDIHSPAASEVFIASSMDREPTANELRSLDNLNARISVYAGEGYSNDEERGYEYPHQDSDLDAEPDED